MGAGRAAVAHRRQAEEHPWPPRWLRWLPPTLVVAAIGLDQATPPHYFFGSLLSASVVLAIFTYPPIGVAATGAAGCALLALTELLADYIGPTTISALIVLGAVTLLSVVLCTTRYRIEGRFRRVQVVAEAVQLALLRPLPARVGPLRLAGFYRAADDDALIGGDLYSVRPTPFGIRVIVGDVKGKGINATQTVATVISSFQEAALSHQALPQVADRIDVALQLDRDYPPVETVSDISETQGHEEVPAPADELFATAVLLEFSSDAREVRILDRGHQPLLIVGRQGTSVVQTEHSLPLGMGDMLPESPRTHTCALDPGDVLVAYSDGITEARSPTGSFYPLRNRIQAHFDSRTQRPSPTSLIAFLERDLAQWAPNLSDDVVVIALQPDLEQPA
ncbi:PP2C family protein-serine/threonine phosphatase [Streptomyces lancefieldiae]|uniref:PP2C family protein-serine/threonine phosphatase n=1 Tax=Streptomyces lancefieldiae TaxID=3075520 RepID=A0ABU3AQE6_9ACTN|nr:PP2C family protein-serine/threonine phosphatase [Streptomyces sp. DSM 40712]MDT0611086.1 PP2C family protein-serine/threonine phosphatase [Streptomyces sp. DSM 40712]